MLKALQTLQKVEAQLHIVQGMINKPGKWEHVPHRELVKELLKEKTPTALHDAESKLGLRYSILLSLPYFDPVVYYYRSYAQSILRYR